jgi:hypothetical protein
MPHIEDEVERAIAGRILDKLERINVRFRGRKRTKLREDMLRMSVLLAMREICMSNENKAVVAAASIIESAARMYPELEDPPPIIDALVTAVMKITGVQF